MILKITIHLRYDFMKAYHESPESLPISRNHVCLLVDSEMNYCRNISFVSYQIWTNVSAALVRMEEFVWTAWTNTRAVVRWGHMEWTASILTASIISGMTTRSQQCHIFRPIAISENNNFKTDTYALNILKYYHTFWDLSFSHTDASISGKSHLVTIRQ